VAIDVDRQWLLTGGTRDKKNPPFGGLKTLFSVGGAFTTAVHDKIVSEMVSCYLTASETMSQCSAASLSTGGIGAHARNFKDNPALFSPGM
jgi:hypothetical protein